MCLSRGRRSDLEQHHDTKWIIPLSDIRSIGVDFGTTNTVVAVMNDAGDPHTVSFRHGSEASSTLRTVLGFQDEPDRPVRGIVEAGTAAISMYLEAPDDTRFLQSIKSHAASRLFAGTRIHGVHHDLEDLLETFLRRAWQYADLPAPGGFRFVVGRPVRFAGSNADETLAMERYKAAFTRLGARDILFVHEPVAAAFFFARRLTSPATVLVADFGGGTTDYSVMRFEFRKGRLVARPLAKGGVGIAGDRFDLRILENVVLPELGSGSVYSSMGRSFTIPRSLYAGLARWETMANFRYSREFRELKKIRRLAQEPWKLDQLIDMAGNDDGYGLYKAVADLKAGLSCAPSAILEYADLSFPDGGRVKRGDFERWIADDISRMDAALVQTLSECDIAPHEIDRVFLTGGTSFVPAVRGIFEKRFDTGIIQTGDELHSISNGLAMIGDREDSEDWAVESFTATRA
ncbi:Hsp70 family protein [Halovulum dunhuangense]|uniref:Hsp70 family protein n=1 Tax=Halovulum dunhuangense TaxID=1505036 RepID=A0A849L2H4_9RHOB|nr:Hsp70 family protein [Halovulum dunhuangense]NNU80444.1 Hsp70 family protein [Halovulum dunhuangense]